MSHDHLQVLPLKEAGPDPYSGWWSGVRKRMSADEAVRVMADFDKCFPRANTPVRNAIRAELVGRIVR